MSGVRTFVAADEGSAACGLVEEAVGISRELRRKMVFRRTEIAGSEKKSVLINFPPLPRTIYVQKNFCVLTLECNAKLGPTVRFR